MDSIRGAAAIAVVIGHANQIFVDPTNSAGRAYFGLLAQAAVMVFFVLSGFLIEKSISRNIERSATHQFSLSKFAIDRIKRLYPALLLSTAFMYLLWRLAPIAFPSGTAEFSSATAAYARTGLHFDLREAIGSLMFMNGFHTITPDMNGPLWSLSVEAWYYVLAASVVFGIRRPWTLLLSLPVIWHITHVNDDFKWYLPVWASGYGLSILHNRGLLKNRAVVWAGIVAFSAVAFAFGYLFAKPMFGTGTVRALTAFNISFGFAFCFMLAAVLAGYLRLPQLMAKSAGYAYTLYLVHVPVFLFVFGITERSIVGRLAAAITVAVISTLAIVMTSAAFAQVVENKKLFSWRRRNHAAATAIR